MLIASGTGTPNVRGCLGTITHAKGDRRILISFDTTANGGKGSGTAFVQRPPNTARCSILDKDMSNNACAPTLVVARAENAHREPLEAVKRDEFATTLQSSNELIRVYLKLKLSLPL